MPLVRFEIRNELSLGGPKLNRSSVVEDEEPKAILGAVEVAGLVGILRQLGDLAEFSAEVFNGIQEEVTVTASRCQKLTSRVKRIESALSPLEKAVLSQTSHIHFAYTAGCEWHPRIRNGQRHFVQSDLPLCVMETYEQCRDPPPLHLLDRFDAGGPGSCLRKYSDPTFFRKELSNPSKADDVKVQRDQAHRKRKKKRLPQRNICRSRAVSVSTSEETNGARLSSFTDDKQATSESTSTVDMPRSSNMQDLSDIVDQSHLKGQSDAQEQSEAQVQSDFQESSKPHDSITGSGYIEYVINQSPVNKPDVKLLDGFLSSLHPAERTAVPESCIEVVDDNILYSPSEAISVSCATIVCDEKKETFESRVGNINKDEEASEIHESKFGPETPDRVRQDIRDFDRTYSFFDEVDTVGDKQSKSQADSIDGKPGIEDQDFDRKYSFFDEVYIVGEKQSKSLANSIDGRPGNENEGENKSEQESEADEFLDARNTIESESESEHDGVPKPNLEHYFGDISTYCSEDANSDNNDGSEDIPFEPMTEDPRHDDSLDEYCSYFPEDANKSCFLSDPVCGKALSHDEMFQKPREFVAMSPLLLPEEAVSNEVREEPVAAHTLLAGDYADEKISFEEPIASYPSLEDDMPAENILPEEYMPSYFSLVEAVPHEKSLPEESVAESLSLAEVVPNEKMLPEKPLPEIPSLVEAMPDNMRTPAEEPDLTSKGAQDDKSPPDFLDSTILSVPEGVSQEQISAEEFVGMEPCLAETVEKVLPEKPLEAHHSMVELLKENIWQEKFDEATHPSCVKAAPEEDISAEVDSTSLSVVEAFPQEEFSPDEIVGIDQCMAETVPDKRTEEPITTYLSLERAVAIEKVLPEKPLETYPSLEEVPEEEISPEQADDAAHPSFSQAVSDEKTLETHHAMAELPIEKIWEEKSDAATHPSCVKAAPEEDISAEVDSTNLSVTEAFPKKEEISLDKIVGIDQCMAEAVPDERTEEPVTTCLSSKRAVAVEKVLPEEPLETHPSLAGLPEEEISHEEAADATHSSFSQAVSDEKVSPEVLHPTYLSVAEVVLQEPISLDKVIGTYPFLVEAVPDESTCLSLEKTVATEKVLPEEILETYPSVTEEKISDEEADTHQSFSEAVSDENISREVLISTNISLEEEKILLEEDVGIYPCFVEAVPDERGLPEEPTTTCMSLTKVMPTEKVLPDEPLEAYASLEQLPKEELSQENSDDATHPSCVKAESDKNVSPEVLDTESLSVEAIPQEQLSLEEEFVGIDPCLGEAFPEEPVTTCLSLTKAEPVENFLPEEPLEVYPSLEVSTEEKISTEEEPNDTTHPSFSEAGGDENISPLEGSGSIYPSLEESVPHEKTSHEEHVGTNPFFELAVPNEWSFIDEPGVTSQSSVETVSKEKNLPEEPLPTHPSLAEPDASCQPFAEASFDENISGSEALGSTSEAGPHNKIFSEEPVDTDMPLAEAVVNEYISSSEASTIEAGPHNKTLPEEPVAMNMSLAEAVLVEKISDSEARGTATEDGSHNETSPEEHVTTVTDMSLAEAVFDEKIPGSEAPDSTTEFGPQNETFTKECVATSSGEPVPDDNILPKEPAVGYLDLAEGIPDQKVFLDDAAFLSFAEAIFDQKFSPDDPDSSVEPVSIWSNGGLLGLAPSKPPVFAGPSSVSEHIQNEINEEASILATRKQESSSKSVDDTEKSSLSLVPSNHTSQQQSNMLNGSLSHLQSTATSFKVFGLSHKLLMAGFRGNSSSTCKFESIPTTSYGTEVGAIEDKTRQTPRGSSFEEQLDYESSLFGSPTSSPPVQHMKISFDPVDASPVSKLKLRIPCQSQRNAGNVDMFPSFQLIPEASNSDDDDSSDIFCQSSPYVSDNCLSDSEPWESDESPRRKSVSSLEKEVGTRGDIGSFSGSFLDLPCFDAVDHQYTSSTLDQDQEQDHKPSVLEIIRQWPPKASPSNEANAKEKNNLN